MAEAPLIRELFPRKDPVARFVLAMGAARNDIRGVAFLSGDLNSANHPLFHFAVLSTWAHTLEGFDALHAWRGKYPEVKKFVSEMTPVSRQKLKRVNKLIEKIGPGGLHAARNALFHYAAPPTEKGKDPALYGDHGLKKVLTKKVVGDEKAVIQLLPPPASGKQPDIYLTFADQARLGLAVRRLTEDLAEFESLSKDLLELGANFAGFADDCLLAYLDREGVDINDLVEADNNEDWPNPGGGEDGASADTAERES